MKKYITLIPPIPPLPPVGVNRFFNIPAIRSEELMPWEIVAMGRPIDTPCFRQVGGFRFRSDIAGGVILVPDGMLSDLASIPEVVQGFFMTNDDPRISGGAWVHDKICDAKGIITLEDHTVIQLTHTQAAAILAYEAMKDLLASREAQDDVYNAVNIFGPKF